MPGKKPPTERKIQRGISLAPDLYERIIAESDKYGRRWNETIELVLARAFPAVSSIPIQAETSRNWKDQPAGEVLKR